MSENGKDERSFLQAIGEWVLSPQFEVACVNRFFMFLFCLFVHHWSASEPDGAQTDGQIFETFPRFFAQI
jgi:hypothetical protein